MVHCVAVGHDLEQLPCAQTYEHVSEHHDDAYVATQHHHHPVQGGGTYVKLILVEPSFSCYNLAN